MEGVVEAGDGEMVVVEAVVEGVGKETGEVDGVDGWFQVG